MSINWFSFSKMKFWKVLCRNNDQITIILTEEFYQYENCSISHLATWGKGHKVDHENMSTMELNDTDA